MSDFKANMHQIRFPLGELTMLPADPKAAFKGPTCKEREMEEVGKGKKKGWEKGRGRG